MHIAPLLKKTFDYQQKQCCFQQSGHGHGGKSMLKLLESMKMASKKANLSNYSYTQEFDWVVYRIQSASSPYQLNPSLVFIYIYIQYYKWHIMQNFEMYKFIGRVFHKLVSAWPSRAARAAHVEIPIASKEGSCFLKENNLFGLVFLQICLALWLGDTLRRKPQNNQSWCLVLAKGSRYFPVLIGTCLKILWADYQWPVATQGQLRQKKINENLKKIPHPTRLVTRKSTAWKNVWYTILQQRFNNGQPKLAKTIKGGIDWNFLGSIF